MSARNSGARQIGRLAVAIALAAGMGAGAASSAAFAAEATEVRRYEIDAGSLDSALAQFGRQSGLQMMVQPELVAGLRAGAVSGSLAGTEVLARLLEGTGLSWELVNGKTIVLRKAGRSPAVPSGAGGRGPAPVTAKDEQVVGMPAVMVKGARTLNMDIERTVDDPQPYVVFDRIALERSGAVNLNDFLKNRLPMNAAMVGVAQSSISESDMSSVNLRGIGVGQTLILVDGRRMAKSSVGVMSGQPDINGIPMEAIERVEVLPTTASAIYGGSATGGVINIILRRDYVGTQASVTYDNSFDTDSAIRRIDLSSGFSLFGGRTSVLLAGSYSESNDLLVNDRDFIQRHQRQLLARDPALYASTLPLGAGANIRSADGSDLVMKDGTPLGSSYASAPDGYAGVASDGGAMLLANAGLYNTDPSHTQSLYPRGGRSSLVGAPTYIKYFSGSARHEFSESLSGFLESSRSESKAHRANGLNVSRTLSAGAALNPFRQDIMLLTSSAQLDGTAHSESKYDRFAGGLVFRLPGQWTAATDYTLTKATTSMSILSPTLDTAAFNSAVADGAVDLLRDMDLQDIASYIRDDWTMRRSPLAVTTKNPAVRLSGPVGALEGGRPWLSMLLERQDTRFGYSVLEYAPGFFPNGIGRTYLYPDRFQKIDSAYVELRIPLLSSLNELPWAKELEFQIAGRWDKYENRNAARVQAPSPFVYVTSEVSEFSPLAAVRFRPHESLALRASYGKGFLPPDINQATATDVGYGQVTFVDPRRGGTTQTVTAEYTAAGNPNLQPEHSTTWSAGLIYTPARLDGLRVSVDYTRLEKTDNIALLSLQQLLDNEAHLAGRIVRGAKLAGDPDSWAGPVVFYDRTYVNLARAKVEAFDIQADYTLDTASLGEFSFFALATAQTRFETELTPASGVTDGLGWTSGNVVPVKLKGNMGMVWTSNPWTLGWTMRYIDAYYVANPASASSTAAFRVQGNGGHVPRQIYHDVFSKHVFSTRDRESGFLGRLLDGLELTVGVRNLFNKTPPYDYGLTTELSQYFSTFGDPRLATYYITLRQSF